LGKKKKNFGAMIIRRSPQAEEKGGGGKKWDLRGNQTFSRVGDKLNQKKNHLTREANPPQRESKNTSR